MCHKWTGAWKKKYIKGKNAIQSGNYDITFECGLTINTYSDIATQANVTQCGAQNVMRQTCTHVIS